MELSHITSIINSKSLISSCVQNSVPIHCIYLTDRTTKEHSQKSIHCTHSLYPLIVHSASRFQRGRHSPIGFSPFAFQLEFCFEFFDILRFHRFVFCFESFDFMTKILIDLFQMVITSLQLYGLLFPIDYKNDRWTGHDFVEDMR